MARNPLFSTDSVNVLLASAAVAGALLGLLSSIIALQLGKPFQPYDEPLIAGPVDEFSPNRFSRMHQHTGAAAVGALGFATLALVFGQSTQLVLAAIFTLALLKKHTIFKVKDRDILSRDLESFFFLLNKS